ncbi:hypothetical protein Tco_1067320 [Tanacetum coccineum]|uniref:Uncharacterized protein n=1 Tax=Tanacetum coccineum TaxID=301880 RepID=A0ABQ5HCS2_9ASTR
MYSPEWAGLPPFRGWTHSLPRLDSFPFAADSLPSEAGLSPLRGWTPSLPQLDSFPFAVGLLPFRSWTVSSVETGSDEPVRKRPSNVVTTETSVENVTLKKQCHSSFGDPIATNVSGNSMKGFWTEKDVKFAAAWVRDLIAVGYLQPRLMTLELHRPRAAIGHGDRKDFVPQKLPSVHLGVEETEQIFKAVVILSEKRNGELAVELPVQTYSSTSRKCRRPPQIETSIALVLPDRDHFCNTFVLLLCRNGPCQGARVQWKFQSEEAACTFVKLGNLLSNFTKVQAASPD